MRPGGRASRCLAEPEACRAKVWGVNQTARSDLLVVVKALKPAQANDGVSTVFWSCTGRFLETRAMSERQGFLFEVKHNYGVRLSRQLCLSRKVQASRPQCE